MHETAVKRISFFLEISMLYVKMKSGCMIISLYKRPLRMKTYVINFLCLWLKIWTLFSNLSPKKYAWSNALQCLTGMEIGDSPKSGFKNLRGPNSQTYARFQILS